MEILPAEINKIKLPLNRDILSHMMKFNTVPDIGTEILNILRELWAVNRIPIITDRSISRKINDLFKKKTEILSKKTNSSSKTIFITNLDSLFDIAVCKKIVDNCSCFNCGNMIDKKFLNDQRSDRTMLLSDIRDNSIESEFAVPSTSAVPLTVNILRSQQQYQHYDETNLFKEYNEFSSPSITSPPDSDYLPSQETQLEKKVPSFEIDIDSFIVSCIARGTSNASAAIHLNCLFFKNENWVYCHASKIQRLKEKARRTETSIALARLPSITALFFDSKLESTYELRIDGHEKSVETVKADHYTLISEPNSGFVGVVRIMKSKQKLKSGEASEIVASKIIRYFHKHQISYDSIEAIGCDGCASNTGAFNGIIRNLEIFLNKPLQWFICILHLVDLLIKNLMNNMIAKNIANHPVGFGGNLGKQIGREDLHTLSIVNFKRIPCVDFPIFCKDIEGDTVSLRDDQDYLFEMCQVVISGYSNDKIRRRKPGPINQARWLTTANRILRLYVSVEDPSTIDYLFTMAEFVIRVYAPAFFQIKQKQSCKYGSIHFFNIVKNSRYLTGDAKKFVDNTLKRNSFWGHPENLMIAMLSDPKHRENVISRIKKIRKQQVSNRNHFESSDEEELDQINEISVNESLDDFSDLTDTEILTPDFLESNDEILDNYNSELSIIKQRKNQVTFRRFTSVATMLNLEAQSYTELTDWLCYPYEPPLTQNKNLETFVCPNFHCHSQNVERIIRTVSRESKRTCSEEALNGNIHVCNAMAEIQTKQQEERNTK